MLVTKIKCVPECKIIVFVIAKGQKYTPKITNNNKIIQNYIKTLQWLYIN